MKTVIGFLSRPHGFNVLSALISSQDYAFLRVYTHKLNPKSQDPSRFERSDYQLFKKTCLEYNIPIYSIDSKETELSNFPKCDYIVEVSWRYLLPEKITKMANIAAFGIHRGKLPAYAGPEPIKQALINNEKEIILSAHILGNQIDQGKIISTISHPVNYSLNSSLEDNIQRLREEITPLFSKLVFDVFNKYE